MLDSDRRQRDPARVLVANTPSDEGFAREAATFEHSLRARVVTSEVEVDYQSSASESREVADRYGVVYVTESIRWAVAWARGPDDVTWQLQDREYLVTDAVHTAGTMGTLDMTHRVKRTTDKIRLGSRTTGRPAATVARARQQT